MSDTCKNCIPRRLGIMGGTFDPIHFGHLVTAEEVRVKFDLDRIIFIPAGQPPHKEKGEVTPAESRYIMTVLAAVDNPHFRVSRLEIKRAGPSYTIDTIEYFHNSYGPDIELFFITGADAVLELVTWKSPDRLLEKCTLVAATRPGYQLSEMDSVIAELGEARAERIRTVRVPGMAISSTMIRRRVRSGNPIRYLLPPAVENFIRHQNLYRGEDERSEI